MAQFSIVRFQYYRNNCSLLARELQGVTTAGSRETLDAFRAAKLYTTETFLQANDMECELQSEEQDLEHYQLRRLLGEGGFGEVYEAWDTKLQRSIAIKRLKPKMLSSRPETLLDEARMAASLRHPAFVKIFSIDGNADQQSIIMEYVDGSTLRKMGEGEPLSESVALDIVAQVAEAMEEAHASKLIHGDLKPSNLMLDLSGSVRIMDFGLARRIDPQSTESVVLDDAQGTIAYLAPELLTGTKPNEQSDVYSLGVVLYEMVTGGRPFPHLNGLALAAAQMQSSSATWPFPPHVSESVTKLVLSMTHRKLEIRAASMKEVHNKILVLEGKSSAKRQFKSWSWRNWQARHASMLRRLAWIVSAVAIGLLAASQFGTITHSTFFANAAFSESAAMKSGRAALMMVDREESIEAAIQHFTSVLNRNPGHAAAAAGLARAYVLRHLGDSSDAAWLQRADASAQIALRLNDQLAVAHGAQGVVLLTQGKVDEALQAADRALRLDPSDDFSPILKSATLMRLSRFDEAKKVLNVGMKLHPTDRAYFDALGTVQFGEHDLLAAEKSFRKSIELQPEGVTAYANLSAALLGQNRGDEALATLQQGLQVRPHWRLYQNLGSVLFDRGDYIESARSFERAVTGGGENRYLNWSNLGDALRWLPGRSDDSRRAYNQAMGLIKPLLAKSPDNVLLQSRAGLYLARLGEKNESLALAHAAIKASPESAAARFRAAIVFELCGKRDSALAELRAAQERKYPPNLISSEPDLIALRRDVRFNQFLPESSK